MINVQKYIDFDISDEVLDSVFTQDIVDKAEGYLKKASSLEKVDIEDELFIDKDFSKIMAYFLEHEHYILFLQMEGLYQSFLGPKLDSLNFDWKVNETLSYSNYFFLKKYPLLLRHNVSEQELALTNVGYVMSVLMQYTKEPILTGNLPLNRAMRIQFLSALG